MEIVTSALEWDSDDIANWSAFLRTRTGQRLIPKAAEEVPELRADGEANAILIRSGEVRGFQAVFRALLALASHPRTEATEPTNENYPNLTDDSKWADGAKIQS